MSEPVKNAFSDELMPDVPDVMVVDEDLGRLSYWSNHDYAEYLPGLQTDGRAVLLHVNLHEFASLAFWFVNESHSAFMGKLARIMVTNKGASLYEYNTGGEVHNQNQ